MIAAISSKKIDEKETAPLIISLTTIVISKDAQTSTNIFPSFLFIFSDNFTINLFNFRINFNVLVLMSDS